MRVNELVERTSLSKSYIYKLLKENKFPPGRKIGRSRYWSEEEIGEFFESQKNQNHSQTS